MSFGVVTREDSLKELARRQVARKGLIPFARYVMPEYKANWHHQMLAGKLMALFVGRITRLMVFMPPQHGKSLLVSILFPVWALMQQPTLKVVQASYAASLSVKHSRAARQIYNSQEVRVLYPDLMQRSSAEWTVKNQQMMTAAHEWETAYGGSYYAVGVDGGLTGRGYDIGIIDDPVKDRKEAESPTIIQSTLDWYRSTFYTRKAPGNRILICQTRWSPHDLSGTLLEEMKADPSKDRWDVIEMPAIDDDGQALWPGRYSLESLLQTKASIGEFEWSALYQQRPTIRGGNRLKADRIQYHDTLEDFPDAFYVRAWDLASTDAERSKSDPDYTVGTLGAVVWDDAGVPHLWVKDMVFGQWEAPRRDATIRAAAQRDGASVPISIEAVGGYKDCYAYLVEAIGGSHAITRANVSTNKSVRAQPLEAIFENGNVHFLRGEWNSFAYHQIAGFPSAGVHDDSIDTLSLIYETCKEGNAPAIFVA